MASTRRAKASGSVVAVEQLGEGGGGVEVGHHHRCGHHLPVGQGHPSTRPPAVTILDTLTWRRSSPPCCSNRPRRWSDMVPMPPRTLDMVASPGEARAKARQSALPGRVGAPVGGVDGQEGQHAADLGVLLAVGEEAGRRRPSRCRTWRCGWPGAPSRWRRRPTSRRGTSVACARRTARWPGPVPRPRPPPRPCPARPRGRARRSDGRGAGRDRCRAGSAARPTAPMLADCTSGS